MNIRIKPTLDFTADQLTELGALLDEPDYGWDTDLERYNKENPSSRSKAYIAEISGQYGTYTVRINHAHKVITVLKVKR